MRVFWTLLRRELSAYFLAPIAYVVMVFFLFIMGISLLWTASLMLKGFQDMMVMRELIGESIFFWIALLIVAPVITMRLYAEEKRAGTFETLMTAPVSDVTVVLSKFCGSLVFYILMWLPTLSYLYIMKLFSPASAPLDPGPMVSVYIGVLLVGSLSISIGLLMSALSGSQMSAAIASFALIFFWFLAGFMPYIPYISSIGWARELGFYISSVLHMIDFSYGIFDTRPLVLYLSITFLMLFLTVKAVESRRWRI